MANGRPKIPLPIRRQVRQRCGFGCVICGLPLYEYHHTVPYAESQVHKADELTLLCDRHHKEGTNGLLTPEQISEADRSPINVARGVSSPYGLHFGGPSFQTVIGGNTFSADGRDAEDHIITIPVSVDDVDLLMFRIDPSGNIFLCAQILDDKNLPALVIEENQLVYATGNWDIEFKGATLIVREGPRRLLFEITFEPPDKVTIDRARLLCNGVEILVRKSHMFVVNSCSVIAGCSMRGLIGLQLGRNQRGLGACMTSNPETLSRYPLPKSTVEASEKEELSKMRQLFEQLGVRPGS